MTHNITLKCSSSSFWWKAKGKVYQRYHAGTCCCVAHRAGTFGRHELLLHIGRTKTHLWENIQLQRASVKVDWSSASHSSYRVWKKAFSLWWSEPIHACKDIEFDHHAHSKHKMCGLCNSMGTELHPTTIHAMSCPDAQSLLVLC
eukprot:5800824-Amphidinium_carterae.3